MEVYMHVYMTEGSQNSFIEKQKCVLNEKFFCLPS